MGRIYNFKALTNKGAEMDFAQYEGKGLMVVNTVVKRYAPTTTPEDIEKDIQEML